MSSTFVTGNTGRSTGAHLDFRVDNPATGKYEDPSGYTDRITVDGKPFDFQVTSGRGMRTHPVLGGQRMHEGIDYATPEGTVLNIDGRHLSTWDDEGGGRMSQYAIQTDDGVRELLFMHGSTDNRVTGKGAVTSYNFDDLPSVSGPSSAEVVTTEANQSQARERAQNYAEMSKAQMNAEYDRLRQSDPSLAADEGMKMHKAFFKKP